MIKKILFLLALVGLGQSAAADRLVWFDGEHPITYSVQGKVAPVVNQALQMFCSDMEMVTGQVPVAAREATIKIVQGRGSDDGFRLSVVGKQIVVEGHNARGTAYGLLELSRMAGVSPWVWWGDVRPSTRSRLTISTDFVLEHTPSVQYRGIFINDEDWSIRPWSGKTFEPGQPMGPKTYKALFQLLLRLRANAIWPAMHDCSPGFFTVPGNKAMADSFGILIGTSHCEPLLRNNVAEWSVDQRGRYNYMTNREAVQHYWIERLKEVKGSEELFTIGMRGIHDGSMEGVRTPEEKLNGLQQVIDDQRKLIAKYYRKDVERVPQVFIPYKEVLEIMESGLRVPDDVTLMWCDDNYGYLTRLPDAVQQQRQGGGGIYYHLSYWGRPHDHLWLATTQPGLIYHEMRTAYDNNCRRLWIANVHDPKVAAYPLELFLDMAWDIDGIVPNETCLSPIATDLSPLTSHPTPLTLRQHLERWLMTQFGGFVGHAVAPAMEEFYRLNAIRKPEFMGWTQVELDRNKYPGGKSVPTTTEFTLKEAYQRMADFAKMEAIVDVYAPMVGEHRKDAYFAHVLYPVHAAAAMSRKMLSDAVESRRAYEEIQSLTERYNAMGGGRWQGLMSAAPRGLPVFGQVHTELPQHPLAGRCIARNASDFSRFTPSGQEPHTVQMLGHSMNAVAVPKGCTLAYEFNVEQAGDVMLTTAMIPTHASDRGDLRYSVTLDDGAPVVISLKEPFRSERWKLNVLRCQTRNYTPLHLTEGRHTLYIQALDNHIVADQWMIDYNTERRFYVIPVEPASSCR